MCCRWEEQRREDQVDEAERRNRGEVRDDISDQDDNDDDDLMIIFLPCDT